METLSSTFLKTVSNFLTPKNHSFLNDEVLSRGRDALLIPCSTLTTLGDTIIGSGYYIGSICTFGVVPKLFTEADKFMFSSSKLISRIYINLLGTVNPKTKFGIISDKKGLFTNDVFNSLDDRAQTFSHSKNLLLRHVASRLTYPLLAISCVITRVADLIIGISASAMSFITLGKYYQINSVAYRGLQAPGLIKDLFYATNKFINPWTGNN